MKKCFFFKGGQGIELYCEIEGKKKSKTAFISFHGLFDSSHNPTIGKVKNTLIKEGYLVFSFDYVGHGKSKGKIKHFCLGALIKDFNYIVNLPELKQKSIFFIGYSIGAYPSIILAGNYPAKGIILFNPATDLLKLALNRNSEKGLSGHTSAHKNIDIFTKLKALIEFKGYDIYKLASRLVCPVFAGHSIDDEIVPVIQTKKLESFINSEKEFIYFPNENHTCNKTSILEKKLIPRLLKWVKRHT